MSAKNHVIYAENIQIGFQVTRRIRILPVFRSIICICDSNIVDALLGFCKSSTLDLEDLRCIYTIECGVSGLKVLRLYRNY
jgi:hypothetical protein